MEDIGDIGVGAYCPLFYECVLWPSFVGGVCRGGRVGIVYEWFLFPWYL
jgi:hypothetical protein